MTEISYALAVLSSITYGAADFLGGLATKRSSTFSVVVFSQLAGLLLMLLSFPFLPAASPTAIDIGWGAASAEGTAESGWKVSLTRTFGRTLVIRARMSHPFAFFPP